MNKIKVLELFAGIHASSKALENIGYEVESTIVEIEKKVVNVSNKLWNRNDEPRDVRDFKGELNTYDLLVGGFPCQPFSNAGKKQGFEDEKGRGDLFIEALRIIKETMPKYVILENVKGILQEKNKWIIAEIEAQLKDMGYNVRTQLINAKYFIPQNRERVFIMASRVEEVEEVKVPTDRTSILKDYLDQQVDDSFYYDMEKILKIKNWNSQEKPLQKVAHGKSDYVKTITTRTQPGTASQIMVLDKIESENRTINISEFLDILEHKNGDIEKWFLENKIKVPNLFSTFNQENYLNGEREREIGTITASGANSRQKILESLIPLKIRSITQFEAMRLMGWKNKDIDKIKDLPKTNIYFVAGNSMVIPVMEKIFKNLLEGEKNDS